MIIGTNQMQKYFAFLFMALTTMKKYPILILELNNHQIK
jgi:hypothetical protein